MYISKVYLSDNFVPDYTIDQFRRRVSGYEVTLKEGEDWKKAEEMAEERIADYIQRNTTATFGGTQVRDIVEDTKEKEDQIKEEYLAVEQKLNEFEFQEDAVAYLNTTTFKHFIPAKVIANSKPIKNK